MIPGYSGSRRLPTISPVGRAIAEDGREGAMLDAYRHSPPVPHYALRPLEITEFEPEPPFRPSPRVWRLSILLFSLTCLTTFYIGATCHGGMIALDTIILTLWHGGPQRGPLLRHLVWSGASYSVPLMGILLLHELGHFLQARRYGVPAIPPMFIPMPFYPFGTMGAVIVQSPHHADRKALFDIAISGPLAGLCLALPVAWWGISLSKTAVLDGAQGAQIFGDPLILKWMITAVHGPLGPNEDVIINPVLMAGWVGVFITALNLTPIGQLDGGHILYCLIGRRAHFVALAFVVMVVAYMVMSKYWAFSVMLMLILMMGIRHPPTTDDRVPLGPFRVVAGWLTLAFLVIGINPRPIDFREPTNVPNQPPPAGVAPEDAR